MAKNVNSLKTVEFTVNSNEVKIGVQSSSVFPHF